MTVKRINHTGRKKILQEDITIVVADLGPRVSQFTAEIALANYELPNDASVFVEAYALTLCQRFSFGQIGNFVQPDDLSLTRFDSVEGLKFRVRVVERIEGRKRILAEANQVSPRSADGDEQGSPLLPVCPSADMGDEIYKVEMEGSPVLSINSSVGDWRAVSTSSIFVAVVYPAVLRQILSEILFIEQHDDIEDEEDWRSQWLRFGRAMPNVGEVPDLNAATELRDWIDSVVGTFARIHGTLSTFAAGWKGA